MAALLPYRGGYYLWHYLPSVPAAVVFLLLFLGAAFGLSYRSWKTHAKFCIVFIIGCFVEVIGYGARASAYKRTDSLFRYILQSTFILIAPTLMAATIYMMFGRVARQLRAEKHSIVRVHWLTKAFVTGDILSFLIQGGAAGMMMIQSMANIGKGMVIVGLVIQIISFGTFTVTSAIFHKRVNNDFSLKASTSIPWERIMRVMYGISILILVRSIFRLVEYAQGTDGYAITHEWTLYVFDSAPMALSAYNLLYFFPAELQRLDASAGGQPSMLRGLDRSWT